MGGKNACILDIINSQERHELIISNKIPSECDWDRDRVLQWPFRVY